MKHWIAGILLVALWAVVLTILLTPEIPQGHGFEHTRFSEMDQGGDGTERHESLLIPGWIFGSVLIALFVSLLAWGTADEPSRTDTTESSRARKSYARVGAFVFGGLIYESVFGMLCLVYRDSLADPDVAFAGPFPAGVSWLLFGIWLIPGLFIVLYVVFFHRWILPPENSQRLAQLVARRRRLQPHGSRPSLHVASESGTSKPEPETDDPWKNTAH